MIERKIIFYLMIPLLFVFAASVWADIPRPEHPRPDFRRDAWKNLNGHWKFSFDPDEEGEEQKWYEGRINWPEAITVPYPWESKLSGVGDTDYTGTAWYQRSFTLPEEWDNQEILLHFGAVDWYAKVWVDGNLAGEHEGGYTPFSFPIRDLLNDEERHTITVMAVDETNPDHPTGKQINWYTHTSGIWQTVYLEAVGNYYITDIDIQSNIDGRVELELQTNKEADGEVHVPILPDIPPDREPYAQSIKSSDSFEGLRGVYKIEEPQLWSPDTPNLYFVQLNLFVDGKLQDSVHTYFGLREVNRKKYGDNPYEYIYLNRKPFYILSALNQAFHPDGIYTYPSDDVIRQDIEDTKEFGFNNLRIHIKVDEPRLYYWADRLGVSILYDLPNTWNYNDYAKASWEKVLRESIARDKNHPSILAWVLFNETWGLPRGNDPDREAWTKEMFNLTKDLDPTRLVEDNSPNRRDHIITDINSWHFYIYNHEDARNHIEHVVEETYPGSNFNFLEGYHQGTEPLMNSEYGGVSAGMGDRDVSWCFHYHTQELRRHQKVCGYIYTELQDIEWEHNGFMNYDRSRKVFGYEEFVPTPREHSPFTYRDINTMDFLILDALAGEDKSDKEKITVPTSLSLYSDRNGGEYTLKWQFFIFDPYISKWAPSIERFTTDVPSSQQKSFEADAYSVTSIGDISVKVNPNLLYLLYAWVEDENGDLVARNFWNFHTYGEEKYGLVKRIMRKQYPREGVTLHHSFLKWKAVDYEEVQGEIDEYPEGKRDSLSIPGDASVTYTVKLPDDVEWSTYDQVQFQVELAACAGIERVDWKQNIRTKSTPQTDVDNKYPSTVEILINGKSIDKLKLPNDPADYRGILSNIFEMAPPSSYGYLQTIGIPKDILGDDNQVKVEIRSVDEHGLRVFGARSGQYPISPRFVLIEEKAKEE